MSFGSSNREVLKIEALVVLVAKPIITENNIDVKTPWERGWAFLGLNYSDTDQTKTTNYRYHVSSSGLGLLATRDDVMD